MSYLAYPSRAPLGPANAFGTPFPFGEREKRIPHQHYPINCYQVTICEDLIATLKLKDYIPIPQYLRIGQKRFSAPGVACQILAWRHWQRFFWSHDYRRGYYTFCLSENRRRASINTWIGCFYGMRPAAWNRLWELNNDGAHTLPQIGDELRHMMADPAYFALESWPETDRIMASGYTPGNQG